MLPVVINPDGESRIVKIEVALFLLGFDTRGPDRCPEPTPEETRQHRAELRREYQRRMQEREREVVR
ncbi:MAG: hypothetical protein ABFC38_02060 [Methanospirillum sp.]